MQNVNHDIHYSMFIGEPGMRKSSAALTYPKPQYWFDFDGKMRALGIPMKKFGINPTDIAYDTYHDGKLPWGKAVKKLEEFELNCKYKTIVIDSITSTTDYMLRQVRKTKEGGKIIGGIPVASVEDFNAESSGVMELISLSKSIHEYHNIDVILIAHLIVVDHRPLNGEPYTTNSIMTAGKKAAAKMPAYCDETYHFDIRGQGDVSKGGLYIVSTVPTEEVFARTALPLPSIIPVGDQNFYDTFVKPAILELKK